MKKYFKKLKKISFVVLILFLIFNVAFLNVFAEEKNSGGLTVGPMNQKVILNPGESYTASFEVSNSISNENNINYELSVEPFYVDNEYKTIFENVSNTGQMAEWITIDGPSSGTLAPNESRKVLFTIDVPSNAPGGGQYASIMVSSKPTNEGIAGGETSTTINEVFRIGHLVFAEITGDTLRQGEIMDVSVPSFIVSGDIKTSSSIKNTGNVHGAAIYKLQIFPLFSDEEIYTNEEDPEARTILPDRIFYNELSWDKTPDVGIFNVVYTVEFEGSTAQVSKMVIKCPIWLMFIILFAIFLLIFYFVIKIKNRKKATKK